MLDILISFERLSIFVIKLRSYVKLNPYILSTIAFLVSNAINVPTLFRAYVKSDQEMEQDLMYSLNNSITLSVCGKGPIKMIWLGLNILFRDFITLLLEITFGILTFIYFKKYLKKRSTLIFNGTIHDHREQTNIQETKITNMILCLSLISIISHIAILATFIFFLFPIGEPISSYLIMISILFLSLKHSLNFFIFYNFNSQFKQALFSIFHIKSNSIKDEIINHVKHSAINL